MNKNPVENDNKIKLKVQYPKTNNN